jgi:hypothetical protein
MNNTNRPGGKWSILVCAALLGYTTATYGQPAVSVEVRVPLPSVEVVLPSVEIHAESDFYEPLAPEGEWVVVGSYGRCWKPGHVARDWRPYSNGHWELTDAGWYWVSDEPWAWATYHYGRWDFTDQYGWYWVPQTQWAPAWVSWHEGGGYVGWAPLQPSVRISAGGFVGFNESRISPQAFVFVKQAQFLDPIRPAIVVANNTTIIKQTVVTTHARLVNNTVFNEGPATAVIEKAGGRKIQAVPVHQLRLASEAAVAARRPGPAPAGAKQVQAPGRSGAEPRESKAVAAPAARPVEKVSPATREPSRQAPGKQEQPARPSSSEPQRPPQERPGGGDKRVGNPPDKERENKPK